MKVKSLAYRIKKSKRKSKLLKKKNNYSKR